MNEWGGLFLGVIAVATLASAIVQISVLVVATRLVRRMEILIGRLEREIVPVFEPVHAIARDAARAASVATAQVERVDKLVTDAIFVIDNSLSGLRQIAGRPVLREMAAVVSALRAVVKVFSDARGGRSRSRDDEDVLFI